MDVCFTEFLVLILKGVKEHARFVSGGGAAVALLKSEGDCRCPLVEPSVIEFCFPTSESLG